MSASVTAKTTTSKTTSGSISDRQKQHVDLYKKLLLRRGLLRFIPTGGAAYVPFIGDGDIAAECYSGRKVFGADLDPERVATAQARLGSARVVTGDCNGWPFGKEKTSVFAVADFDSYCYPYDSWRAFMANAKTADTLLCFFTDGVRQGVMRMGTYHRPNGETLTGLELSERRRVLNAYWAKEVWPWFQDEAEKHGYEVTKKQFYLRHWMFYWGAILKR